jgi:hypothetical protein
MRELGKKLTLRKKSMTVLNENQAGNVRGGLVEPIEEFLSIGCACSKANHCDRTLTNTCN